MHGVLCSGVHTSVCECEWKLQPPADAAVKLHITSKVSIEVNCIKTQYRICLINYSIDKLITLLFFRSLFNSRIDDPIH